MDFLQLMRDRYTTKVYDPAGKVSNEQLEQILEAIRLTPSSVNLQPWHFYVINTPEAKALVRSGVKDFNLKRFDDCAAVIVFAAKTEAYDELAESVTAMGDKLKRYADAHLREVEHTGRVRAMRGHQERGDFAQWAACQTYIALGTALYAAKAAGLDATPIEGIFPNIMDEKLNLKEVHEHALFIVCLGHHAADDFNQLTRQPKNRRSAAEVISCL